LLRETYCVDPPAAVQPFVDHFREVFGEGLAAVVFYGSRLDGALSSETSTFDFYLVCDEYSQVFSRRRDRLLARVLPPSIYSLDLPVDGGVQRCKYCVISRDDLRREVGAGANDFYHLGRFSKRLAVVWTRDSYERDEVLACCWQAMRTITEHAINKVSNEFTLDEFILKALALSYEAEVRLEKTDEKVRRLFDSAKQFYRHAYSILLAELRDVSPDLFHTPQEDDPAESYFLRRSVSQRARMHEETRYLIKRSRRRGKLRWPKNIVLVDNWVDPLLEKVERTYGVKIELTPTERRWLLIFGWKHYFRLKREGKIR